MALRKAVMKEINSYLHGKMLRKAQRVGLTIHDNNKERVVSSFSEIGKAFKYDGSVECAVKLTESFDDDGVFSYYCETRVMNNLKLKYIEEENSDKDVGCIARMVVKRKCDISKVFNKRAGNTHAKKVLVKRTPDEVKENPIKDRKQAFVFSKKRWFTKESFEVNHNGEIEDESLNYYKQKYEQLQKKFDDREKVCDSIMFAIALLNFF